MKQCPTCGADKSNLDNFVHDYTNDCGNCRPIGITGPELPPKFPAPRSMRVLSKRKFK